MLVLVDGDIVVYRLGWVSENFNENIARSRARDTLELILKDTGATEYQVWLSDSLKNNFRYQIDPEYKANRKDSPKPKHYQMLKDYLLREWNAQITAGQEADDELGIQQCAALEIGQQSVISGIDKDLLMIPGLHHNWVKRTIQEVSYLDGIRHFYKQTLIGDSVDNIRGVYGIGPKKASQRIDGLTDEVAMYRQVESLYQDEERLHKNCNLLWIRRRREEWWAPPTDARTDDVAGSRARTP